MTQTELTTARDEFMQACIAQQGGGPVSMKNGLARQMVLKTTVIDNAVCYTVEVAPGDDQGQPGDWTDGGLHTKSSAMPPSHLTPGRLYTLRLRAVGRLTEYSDWSNVLSGRSL